METPTGDAGLAASINPATNNLVLELGQAQEETVTVTIPPNIGVNKADVYLLADTTGSMGSTLAAVKTGANAIVGAPYAGVDMAFGVGNYRDLPATNPPFIHQSALTTNKPQVTAEINNWVAQGGNDHPEGQLFALHNLAEAPGGAGIGWRPDSKRIIVWFGDAPGHDPICDAMSGIGIDITEESVKDRLEKEGITVIAISVNGKGLDDDPTVGAGNYSPACDIGGSAGQATRIASKTGGKHVDGIKPEEIVDTIIDLIETAIRDIGEVTLVPTAPVAPFVESISPTSFKNLPGELEHVLEFKVMCRGVEPCIDDVDAQHGGALDAVADSAIIASQAVNVTVPKCDPLRLTRFVLVNADTNEDIRIIAENDIFDMNELPPALNVRVDAGSGVQSVTFALSPHNEHFRGQENMRPFSLFGDTEVDNYNAGSFANGSHSLSANPFAELGASGAQGDTLSVNFEVING